MNHVIEGALNKAGDSYKSYIHPFTLEEQTNLFLTLHNLKRDLDLYVTAENPNTNGEPFKDSDDNLIHFASSTNDRTENESIFLQLKPGKYFAEIKENNGANTWAGTSTEEDYSFTLELDDITFDKTTTLSNDPYLSYQWYLFNTGLLSEKLTSNVPSLFSDFPVATPNVDIRAPEAWNLRTDGSGIILAIIDTGVDLEHPDLKDNLWRNEGEIPGNGEDDDNNGLKDDIHGWNFVDKKSTITKATHGTHVAGIAAASGNNGIGISGVAWNAKIMSLEVLTKEGGGKDEKDFIDAIYYAVDNGAKVINMSLGGNYKRSPLADLQDPESKPWRDAFAYAKKNDVFIAIAAGNEDYRTENINKWKNVGDLDTYATNPAVYSRIFSNIATVISTDSNNEKAIYSNYGQSATIAAPGGDTSKLIDLYVPSPGEPGKPQTAQVNFGILSTVPVGTGDGRFGGDYDFLQGTSMASPVIAGMATLIRSANASITAQDTLAILRAGATAEPGLLGSVNGGLTANLEGSLLIAENWTGPSDLLKLHQSEETPVVNLSFLDQGALGVTGTTTATRNAAFDPITGFYKAVDAFGSVYDSLGNLVRPGDSTYADIALNSSNIVSSISNVSIGDMQSTTNNFEITDSAFLAPYAKVNGNTWFAFKEANSDNFAHFKLLGDNKFGLEDLEGGGDQDFNDHIITFKVDALI